MPTIAELQIKVDSVPLEKGTKATDDLRTSTEKLTKALVDRKAAEDALNRGGPPGGGGGGPGGGGGNGPKPINDISTAIDNQTKKLKALEEQRKALNNSSLKTDNPEEYRRLNQTLDARIELTRRQGNALDQLSRQEERARKRAEQKAESERKQQEALAAAVLAREAAVAKAAEREQRQFDQTINSLSRQIAAQQEYNRTIEQLKRARTVGVGGDMMGTGGRISSAEYESYVQLAEAKLRDSMATKDQSNALSRLQSRIDSVTATFGRAERAQVKYTRDVETLNQGLAAGLLTTEQYNQRLQQTTALRDRAIQAANSNAAAEAQFNAQLRATVVAYDPVARATDVYNNSINILSQGLQSGKLSVEQFNKALTDQRIALDRVKEAQPGSSSSQANQYQQALDRLLPYNAQLRNLAESERVLQQAQASGKVVTDQQKLAHQQATEAIAAERKEIERRTDASRRMGNSAKQDAAAMRGLPAQFTDIVVSLQGGQAPLTVLLQQGGQIKDMFGGIVPALKAMGAGIVAMVGPFTLLTGLLVTVATAAHAGASEFYALGQAMVKGGGFSGASISQLTQFRDQLDTVVGTAGKAAEALVLMESSGKIAADMFLQIGEAAITMERATGESLEKIISDFSSLAKDPVQAAVTLDEKYKFLTADVLATADAMVRQGDSINAVKLLQGEMANATDEAAERIIASTGSIERGWKAVLDTVKETWDGIKGIGRDNSASERLANLLAERDKITKNLTGDLFGGGGSAVQRNELKGINVEIEQLRQRIGYEKILSDQAAESERIRIAGRQAASKFATDYRTNLTAVARAQYDVNEVTRNWTRIQKAATDQNKELTDEQKESYKVNLAGAEKRLKDAKEAEARAGKDKTSPLDTNSVVEVKSNLSVLTAEYDGYYKRIEALRSANQINEEGAYYAQLAILNEQRKKTEESYNAQISAIKALQGNKSNTASANISLENQLTKAEAARLKALEDNQTKEEQLTARFQGDMKKRKDSIEAYTAALERQVQALKDQGARSVLGAGLGDRQRAVDQQLFDNDKTRANEEKNLSRQLAAQQISPEEYAANMKALAKSHSEMSDIIIDNDKRVMEANADWTNGVSRSLDNLKDRSQDVANTVERALTGAFNSAGDALGEFVVTGKMDFADFTRSVLADMARMAASQAASSVLSTLFQVGMTAFSAYAGGGNGMAAGSAGATSSNLGASQAGYSSTYFPQANGGAWSNGVKFFANGGMFTNSVVSSPTAFSHANGLGVMGEAGPEAIMPLSRSSDGKLGVRMTGAGGTGASSIYVNVYVTPGEGGSSETNEPGMKQFGDDLAVFVDNRYRMNLSRDLKDGGAIRTSLKNG